MIAPELMHHVTISYNLREFVFHGGSSFNMNSILETGLIAGGREARREEKPSSSHLLNSFVENPDEEALYQ